MEPNIVAQDVRELKKALTKAEAAGAWSVKVDDKGVSCIVCYDAFGKVCLTIRSNT